MHKHYQSEAGSVANNKPLTTTSGAVEGLEKGLARAEHGQGWRGAHAGAPPTPHPEWWTDTRTRCFTQTQTTAKPELCVATRPVATLRFIQT